jgi:hypothetical protein
MNANPPETAMSRNSKQDWTVGQTVRVGFMSLGVVAALEAAGDGNPGAYILTNGTQLYSFVPHNGVSKITDEQAVEMCEESKRISAARAARAQAQVARVSENATVCARLKAIAA